MFSLSLDYRNYLEKILFSNILSRGGIMKEGNILMFIPLVAATIFVVAIIIG
ncbi:MAG: hypothetical protein RSA01_06450 [Clostridium sp.]|uniref:hypothetical protein n=1 Tax=Clostridium sp. TaxID=1506 RepID=UPI002FCC1AA9